MKKKGFVKAMFKFLLSMALVVGTYCIFIFGLWSFFDSVAPKPVVEVLPSADNLLISPMPSDIKIFDGEYIVGDRLVICVQGNNDIETNELYNNANYLKNKLNFVSDINVIIIRDESELETDILISTKGYNNEQGRENYFIDVSDKKIVLSSYTSEGAFRGIQSLIQLLMYDMEAKDNDNWSIPCLTIFDKPQYEFRSMMLDVARHFRSVDEVKQVIDYLAFYKFNTFHIHLSDDQGFRIEIKSWPKLTEIGSKTEIGGGAGGFYTQEDYKEIVKYASDRYITVVPEIDMPSHTNAILSSYGELNPDGKVTQPYTGMEVGFSSLMCREEITYEFLEDVLGEIAALTPGKYIHIGGDEAHSTSKEDYRYFVGRVNEIIKGLGKTAIGWDPYETSDGIDGSSLVQRWSDSTPREIAENKGMKIIVSQARKAYIDMKYYPNTRIGLQWAAIINTKEAYQWKLTDFAAQENIIGIECPLWAETLESMDDVEYLMFPRLIGHGEKGWSDDKYYNWDIYKFRLRQQLKYLDLLNVNYFEDKIIFK